MIKEKVIFHPSVNIRFDLGKEDLYERYLPTPSHAEAMSGLLSGFLHEGRNAHILVGPYGSGKSMLGTILSGLVSENTNKIIFDSLESKFNNVDANIYNYIKRARDANLRYIPVILNGYEGNFRRLVLSSAYKTLKKCGLDLTLPNIASGILNKVNLWKSDFYETYSLFLALLDDEEWTLHTWTKDIEDFDIEAINWFREKYPLLTSGADFSLQYDGDMVPQIEIILKELNQHGYGLFLVYDEFGRYLQNMDLDETFQIMQDLQDLAELADKNESKNLNVLLITHRNLNHYSTRFNDEIQKEFQRIEKRYCVYYTHSDPSTFIRIAHTVTKDYREQRFNTLEIEDNLWKYELFPNLNNQELDSYIIKGSFPLHPITLFALPHLTNLVAQNERTLFTFLESHEQGSLNYYFDKHQDWYRVDSLFDYFEPAFLQFERESLIGQKYSLYLRIKQRLSSSEVLGDEHRIIKFLSLWDIAALHGKQSPTVDLISFALSLTPENVIDLLRSLEKKKMVRFTSIDGYWELFEGSSIDIEDEISKRRNTLLFDKRNQMALLRDILDEKVVLSKQYNLEHSITRFASIYPVYSSELLDNERYIDLEGLRRENESDMAVIYVIPDRDTDIRTINEYVKDLSSNQEMMIFAVPEKPINEMEENLCRLKTLRNLLEDKYFLASDPFLEEELNKYSQNITFEINTMLYPITHYSHSIWFYMGVVYTIKSKFSFNKILSETMGSIYDRTPEIRNESFNRRKITKVQKRAALIVLNKLLNYDETNGINITGYGPDYLIYVSVLKNNGINLNRPYEITDQSLGYLRKELVSIIGNGKGQFIDLVNKIKQPPFGIRQPVIPLLLVSLLMGEWKHLMFYQNGMYISNLDAELLYHMVENPESYTFSYQVFDKKYFRIKETVEELFCDFIQDEDRNLPSTVYLNRILLRWLRSLPRITQNTLNLSSNAIQFKQLIRSGEVRPDTELDNLYHLIDGQEIEVLSSLKCECGGYYLEHEKSIEESVFNLTGKISYEELTNWANEQTEVVKAKNTFFKCILNSDKSNWVESLTEKVVGVKRENWSDATHNLFLTQIENDLKSIESSKFHDAYVEIKVNDRVLVAPKVELSHKAKTLYQNLKTDLKYMGRKIPKEEIQALVANLLQEILEEDD